MGLFTNEEIFRVALEQSAIDSNCKWEDFLKKDNVIVTSVANPSARRYLKLPHACDLTTYGNNIVATISEEYRDIVECYISKYAVEHCFETIKAAGIPISIARFHQRKHFSALLRNTRARCCGPMREKDSSI